MTPAQKGWFLNPFAALSPPERFFASEAEARTIWAAHRDEWLAEYAANHPGERAPASLRFDT